MREAVRQVIKRGMAVHFIVGRFVKTFSFTGVGSMDVFTLHYPDAYTFLPAGVHIAGVLHSHLRIGCVQAAHVLVIEPLLAADKHFP